MCTYSMVTLIRKTHLSPYTSTYCPLIFFIITQLYDQSHCSDKYLSHVTWLTHIASDSALSARIRIDALMQWILQYQQPQHKHDLHDSLGYCSEYTSILSGSQLSHISIQNFSKLIFNVRTCVAKCKHFSVYLKDYIAINMQTVQDYSNQSNNNLFMELRTCDKTHAWINRLTAYSVAIS